MADQEEGEYELMLLLERLESLREDMQEMGITNIEQLNQRVADLHRQLDELEEKERGR